MAPQETISRTDQRQASLNVDLAMKGPGDGATRDHQPDRPEAGIPDTPGVLQCSHCGKIYKSRSSYSTHINRFHKEAKLTCSVCGKKFRRNYDLKRHMFFHSGLKPFECVYCNKCFSSKYGMQLHSEGTHTDTWKYQCSVCQKGFNVASMLKYHERSHTQERFRCEKCNKPFIHKSSCTRHQIRCDGQIGPKVKPPKAKKEYECLLCGKRFSKAKYLRQHTILHNAPRHTCHFCGKTFKWASCMNSHYKRCHAK